METIVSKESIQRELAELFAEKKGRTRAQAKMMANSTGAQELLKMLLDGNNFFDKAVLEKITEIKNVISEKENIDKDIESLKQQSDELRTQLKVTEQCIQQAKKEVKEVAIQDIKVKEESSLIFRATLEHVKDVFGKESMKEDVIIAAIQAGSYGMWRKQMEDGRNYRR